MFVKKVWRRLAIKIKRVVIRLKRAWRWSEVESVSSSFGILYLAALIAFITYQFPLRPENGVRDGVAFWLIAFLLSPLLTIVMTRFHYVLWRLIITVGLLFNFRRHCEGLIFVAAFTGFTGILVFVFWVLLLARSLVTW